MGVKKSNFKVTASPSALPLTLSISSRGEPKPNVSPDGSVNTPSVEVLLSAVVCSWAITDAV